MCDRKTRALLFKNAVASANPSDMTSEEPMTSSQPMTSRQAAKQIELLDALVSKMVAWMGVVGERSEWGGGAPEMDEWRFAAMVLDRACFWLVAVLELICSGTMFILSLTSEQ